MYLQGVLIEARDLVNGVSIVQAAQVEKVEYFHIELHSHDVIIAEDSPSETFVDDNSRGIFHNAHEYPELYPDADDVPARYCAPRRNDGYDVETARRLIDARAGLRKEDETLRIDRLRSFVDTVSVNCISGWAQNTEHPETPVCLDILAGDTLIAQVLANRYRDDLERAGLGSGRHAFAFTPRAGFIFRPDEVSVRRSLDRAALELTFDIQRSSRSERKQA